jgi:hypothetical protein
MRIPGQIEGTILLTFLVFLQKSAMGNQAFGDLSSESLYIYLSIFLVRNKIITSA